MKIYLVGVSDCEGNMVVALCSTLKIAKRELFKERDRLIKEFQKFLEYEKKLGLDGNMYQDMIKSLSGNNYKEWDNYPHECPYIRKMTLMEE